MTRPAAGSPVGEIVHGAEVSFFGPVRRALLAVQDSRLRRCTFCGDWCYHHAACDTCGTPEPAQADGRVAS